MKHMTRAFKIKNSLKRRNNNRMLKEFQRLNTLVCVYYMINVYKYCNKVQNASLAVVLIILFFSG